MTLMFRNESDEVIRKARARKGVREQRAEHQKAHVVAAATGDHIESYPNFDTHWLESKNSTYHLPSSHASGVFLYPTTPSLEVGSPESSIEEQAACFFMTHYISLSRKIDELDSPLLGANQLVFLFGSKLTRDARICLGLAGLANVRNDQSIMELARSRHTSALRQTIEALQNPVEVKKDETLRAAVMLAMFELVTCDHDSKKTWTGHVTGAAALLKARGLNGLVHRDEIRTFVQLRFEIFIKCLSSDESVPADIVEWFNASKEYQFEWDSPAWWLAVIFSRFVNLRASIRRRELTDATTIISGLSALNADLAKWVTELPPEWIFTTVVSTEDSEIIFESQCHVYHSLWIAVFWNHYRTVCILVNDLLIGYLDLSSCVPLEESPGVSQEQRRQCLDLVSLLATDICYSVPFQHNHNGLAQNNNAKLAPTLTGAFAVLWPLRVAASTTGASEALYQWARSLLQSIGYKKGIRLALILIEVMDAQRRSWQAGASTITWGNNQLH
ncbi:hypothetical protein MMC11_004809 [Xylographa trunciseda]|nr:hypothetical protein [Xylographa trunciseda]